MNVIAFDWDGTLLDSRFRHQKVLADVLGAHGIEVRLESLGDFVPFKAEGLTTADYLRARLPSCGDPRGIVSDWLAHIELQEYLRLDRLYPEALGMLNELAGVYRLALVSARQHSAAFLEQANQLRAADCFCRILCVQPGPEAGARKAHALKEHFAKQVCMVVGDTEVDEECADLVGAAFHALSHGFRSAAWWKKRGRLPCESLLEVLGLIECRGE